MSTQTTQSIGAAAQSLGPAPEPLAVTLRDATRISGLSRSLLYRCAGRGELVFRKCGSRVVVPLGSLQALIAGLPQATVRLHVRDRAARQDAIRAHRATQFRDAR